MSNEFTKDELIDLESGMGRVRGNATLYKRMLGLFSQSEEFAAFETAFAENDISRAAEVMHGIKGMSGNLSMTKVFDLSSALMGLLRAGTVDMDMIEEYRDAVEATNKYVEELMQTL